MNVLFVCSRARHRSPTAEAVFLDRPGLDVASAGTAPDADEAVTPELLAWADLVVAMEQRHKQAITRRFSGFLATTRVVVLNIPDLYEYMAPELVTLLERRVARHLRV